MNKTFTVLGDSISKGVLTKNNKICLAKHNPVNLIEKYFQININNYSVYGQTLKRLYDKNTLQKIILSLNKKDNNFVVLSLGGNDADYDWQKVAQNPELKFSPATPLKQFKKILQNCITKLKKNKINIIITTILPLDSERYFKNVISKKADKNEILKFLKHDLGNISRQQECYNIALIRIAMKNNCPILDLRSQFLLNRNYLKYLSKDGVHPNETGYKKIASLIIKTIKTKDFLRQVIYSK